MNKVKCFKSKCKIEFIPTRKNICEKCIEYYCDVCMTKTFCSKHAKTFLPQEEQKSKQKRKSEYIIKLVKEKNIEELNKLDIIPGRLVIAKLKNDLENLEFFFAWFSKMCGGMLPGSGSYHFNKIQDIKTFDIYKKYGFGPENLWQEDIPKEQWDYLVEIGYVSESE